MQFAHGQTHLCGMQTHLGGAQTHLSGVQTQSSGVQTHLGGAQIQFGGRQTQLSGVQTQSTGAVFPSIGAVFQFSGAEMQSKFVLFPIILPKTDLILVFRYGIATEILLRGTSKRLKCKARRRNAFSAFSEAKIKN